MADFEYVVRCGTGTGNFPKPGDPDNNIVLTATTMFGGIMLAWTFPEINPHAVAYIVVYRGINPSFNNATEIARIASNHYFDAISAKVDTTYYYWIQVVSVNGTVGDLIGPASGVAVPSIRDIMEDLTAQIDEGLLAQTLRDKLNQISILNDNLLNEIMARENDTISLGDALNRVDQGVSEALTFIHQEINSRVTDQNAIAEQLNLVVATLEDQYASVTSSMVVNIDNITNSIDAMYTAKVDVNGLIGGFGIHNDGHTVDAGFDVDRFWVGRTVNKVKPFIIDDTTVYINEAMIADASITNAKIGQAAISSAKIEGAAITNALIKNLAVNEAKISNLAVSTLKIQGNAVTLAQTAVSNPQKSITSVGYTTVLQFTVTITGTQPVLVWGSLLAAGVHASSSSDYDQYYDGNYWKYNEEDTGQSYRFVMGSYVATGTLTGVTVLAGKGLPVTLTGMFMNVAAGTYTLYLQVAKDGVYNSGCRQIAMTMLETKR